MQELDTVLSAIENPTRRKILQALVREPHYPLQLSRELGVSQQAIAKNLNVLEKCGLVESWKESSNRGPDKTIYRSTSSFTLTIDMREGMFMINLASPENGTASDYDNDMELKEIRMSLLEIDRQIDEFDKLRANIIEHRNTMINSFMNRSFVSDLDYLERNLLYGLLNRPDHNIAEVSKDLGMREDKITELAEEIEYKCKKRDEK